MDAFNGRRGKEWDAMGQGGGSDYRDCSVEKYGEDWLCTIMESVSELPGHIHFYRLLYLLSRHNQVLLRVPDSLISGFGFPKPVRMLMTEGGIRFQELKDEDTADLLATMNPYTDQQRLSLPRFVLKTPSSKLALPTLSEALHRWHSISTRKGPLYTDEGVLQAFLVSPEKRAQRVRVAWSRKEGVKAEWAINEEPYFRPRKKEEKRVERRTVTFAGVAGELSSQRPPEDPGELDETQLFISPFAVVTPGRLSPATAELGATLEYVKKILESTMLAESEYRLCGLAVDMLKDVRGKWFFLSIDSYQLAEAPASRVFRSLPVSTAHSKPISRASCPTSRLSSPTPDIPEVRVFPPSSSRPPLTRRTTPDPLSKRQPQKGLHSRQQSDSCFQYILKKQGFLTDRKEWEQAWVMEKDIAGLIGLDRPLSHMTYRGWRERLGMKLGAGTVDFEYAKKIVGKAKEVRKEAESQQQHLISLKNKMIDLVAVASLTPSRMAQNAGKVLLDRINFRKFSSSSLNTAQEKMLKQYQEAQNLVAGERSARDMMNYAVNKIDVLRKARESERQKDECV